jgi:TolB-like protein
MEPRAATRLDSWKEIAAYLRRGARTVQRWEREEGLPVRRLLHEKLGSIYAYKHELDAWFARRGETSRRPATLAVLPFADLSQDRRQRCFCEGLAEEITLALSRIDGLNVTALRDSAPPPGVQSLLQGSVRTAGERLRIAVQWIDAKTGFHLWGESFDGVVGDVFELQDEIAGQVREALELKLRTAETGPCGPVPIDAVQRVPTTSRTPCDLAYSRGSRDGATA